MFRRLRLFVARSASSRRLVNGKSVRPRRAIRPAQPSMLETVHEIAIYIHRFHNLDLFQQGWYQLKITMRWEDSERTTLGTPARVVQYEAPNLGSNDFIGVWKIDDADNSFCTQPFRIKYARQDVHLAVMISFNLPIGNDEIPSTTSAVVLKFELKYYPVLENGSDVQETLDTFPAAIHEFRIPPKALLGLHSYSPVHFDAFHAVLVDISIHIVYLKAGSQGNSKKVTSNSNSLRADVSKEYFEENSQILEGDFVSSKANDLVKSLFTARKVLFEQLQHISKAIGQNLEELPDAESKFGKLILSSGASGMDMERKLEDKIKTLKKSNSFTDSESDTIFQSLSNEELLCTFNHLGSQLSLLWNAFLKFHRVNRVKILEQLRHAWASDRKAEWSIWMVHNKAEIPHRYLKSGKEDTSHQNVLGRASLPRKLTDDPAQNAITRSELHRRSIAQMKINSRTIQDMHLFGDPTHVPVILVEKNVLSIPLRSASYNSYLNTLDEKVIPDVRKELDDKFTPRAVGAIPPNAPKSKRILKLAVFVHGFQGHHLDLRLVRNQWLLIDPLTEFLMSEANEERTSDDFREMGKRLAQEVGSFLRKKMDKASRFGGYSDIKLSFVGHSIGNIIIRSALTDSIMEPFLRHLYTYMSLSGPHLGYCYSSNSLFNSGLWLLKKLKGAQCIHQLTFTDDPDLQNTFFYKLSQQKTLEYFRNVILVSSPQDGYVPYHSARIELCQASSWDNSKKSQVFMEMLNNCLDQIRAPSTERRTFMRCDVNFDMTSQGRSLNTFIGRAAHIEFLEADTYARLIMWSYPELFM